MSVPRKPSPVKTDYIHPTVEISAREYIQTMIGSGNKIKIIADKCLGLDRDHHKYFSGTGKSFVIICYKFQNLFI